VVKSKDLDSVSRKAKALRLRQGKALDLDSVSCKAKALRLRQGKAYGFGLHVRATTGKKLRNKVNDLCKKKTA